MNNRKIDDQIRDYYGAQRPSPEAMELLKQTIRSGTPARRSRRAWIAVAAVAALAVFSFVWTAARHRLQSPHELAASVAQQAALGHNEKRQLDFHVTDCSELQRQMKSLDFTPVEPMMIQHMNMRIVGARYATLGGEMAVQIVYLDANGIPCTLYEVRPVDRLARLPDGEHEIDGVHVRVWKEKGLVMVLARPMA